MTQRKPPRMQHRPRETIQQNGRFFIFNRRKVTSRPISGISDDGMMSLRKMHAELVRPARFNRNLQTREFRRSLLRFGMRHRTSAERRPAGEFLPVNRVTPEGEISRPRLLWVRSEPQRLI